MTVPLHEKTVILLVDAQPSFLDQMHGAREPVEARLERLLRFARMTAIPVIATFERPTQKKGLLPPPLEAALPPAAGRFEKSTFDAASSPT